MNNESDEAALDLSKMASFTFINGLSQFTDTLASKLGDDDI